MFIEELERHFDKMPDDVLTNEELMARLRAHNYPFPPVTPSTRGVLLKKLAQLDAEKKKNRARSKIISFCF